MRLSIALAGLVALLLFAAGCSSPQSIPFAQSTPGTSRSALDVIAVPLGAATPTANPTANPIGASAFPIGASAFPIGLSAFPIGASAFPVDSSTGCTVVTDSLGHRFRAARLGGGDHITIDKSKANCDVGVYVDAKHGPAKFDHTSVTGAFLMGIYIDTVAKVEFDHTAICVNGANGDFTCKAGSGQSGGVGLVAWMTGTVGGHLDHLNIQGYAIQQTGF